MDFLSLELIRCDISIVIRLLFSHLMFLSSSISKKNHQQNHFLASSSFHQISCHETPAKSGYFSSNHQISFPVFFPARYLNSIQYPYACELFGVFRDDETTCSIGGIELWASWASSRWPRFFFYLVSMRVFHMVFMWVFYCFLYGFYLVFIWFYVGVLWLL